MKNLGFPVVRAKQSSTVTGAEIQTAKSYWKNKLPVRWGITNCCRYNLIWTGLFPIWCFRKTLMWTIIHLLVFFLFSSVSFLCVFALLPYNYYILATYLLTQVSINLLKFRCPWFYCDEDHSESQSWINTFAVFASFRLKATSIKKIEDKPKECIRYLKKISQNT